MSSPDELDGAVAREQNSGHGSCDAARDAQGCGDRVGAGGIPRDRSFRDVFLDQVQPAQLTGDVTCRDGHQSRPALKQALCHFHVPPSRHSPWGNGLEAAYLATKSNIRCTSDAAFPELVEIKCIATGAQVIAVLLLVTFGPSCRTIHFTGPSNAVSGNLMVVTSYHRPSKRPAAVRV